MGMFFKAIGRITIRWLTAIGRYFAGMVRGIFRYPARSLFTLLLLGGVFALAYFTNFFGLDSGPSKNTSKEAEADDKRRGAAEQLMSGLTTFDSSKIWTTFSPAYQKELSVKGISQESIQKAFDKVQKDAQDSKSKLGYVGYLYRVTLNFKNGTSTDTYVSVLQVEDQVQQLQYMILVDSNNKVSAIGTDDPVLSQVIGRKKQG